MFRALAKQEDRALLIVTHDPKVRTSPTGSLQIRDGRDRRARTDCRRLGLTRAAPDDQELQGGNLQIVLEPRSLGAARPGSAVVGLPGAAAVTPAGKPAARSARPAAAAPVGDFASPPRAGSSAYPGAEVVVGTDLGGHDRSYSRCRRRTGSAGASSWPSCGRTTTGRLSPRRGRGSSKPTPTSASRRPRSSGPRPLAEKRRLASGGRQGGARRRRRAGPPRRPPRRPPTASRPSSPKRGSSRRSTASSSPGTRRRARRSRPDRDRDRRRPVAGRGSRPSSTSSTPDASGSSDEVRVTAEGYDGKVWQGRVEEIPDAVVGRRLKPQDPGKPEDTRVLLVKVALLEPTPLKLGQRVEIRID